MSYHHRIKIHAIKNRKTLLAALIAVVSVLCPAIGLYAQSDRFAEIGNKIAAVRTGLLINPQPPQLAPKTLTLANNAKAAFKPMQWLDTNERLQDSLNIMRNRYASFLQDLSPDLPSLRIVQSVTSFNWRKETLGDKEDFNSVLNGEGSWQAVHIPHYGPPLGLAVTYYRTDLFISKEMIAKGAVFIRYKGVDYKSETFINGSYVGSHEGVFAPFEFDISSRIKEGKNSLLVKVYNDYIMQGGQGDDGRSFEGDKLYAATGLGYDTPETGWHHCPPGMGIYQDVTVEGRNSLQIQDVFVRPMNESDTAEVWIEILNARLEERLIKIRHSLYGQNFKQTVYEKAIFEPRTLQIPGVGDLAKVTDNTVRELKMGRGVNFLKFKIVIPGARRWNTETPWLYQLQVELMDQDNHIADTRTQQFGMRSFRMDTVNIPKGMMYLNNEPVRLRGANTMGAFQQSVFKKDWKQLENDILLAKITHMNYIRMTQMPVQSEVYDYCDRLGLMTQTDLPLFGVLKRAQWIEAVRQAEEMEKLVRSHPCNIMVTYINERFPNAEGSPQKNLDTYEDFERFFKAADQAVLMNNPDQVIKAGDGDYDPPSPGLPDNHCYNGWYNGHGLGLGEMHKGYWLGVKPGWYYACGEFGSEGLDPVNTMRKYYPPSWLPQNTVEEKSWTPGLIPRSQTFDFHYMWFNTPHTLMDWADASQAHQATITRLTTEAFRRDNRMVSFAIHLFIDAFPSGWMKAIMDVNRQPKKAWFEYAHALEPLAVQVRTDRYRFFSGDSIAAEAWIVNDKNTAPDNAILKYQVEMNGKIMYSGSTVAGIPFSSSKFQGYISCVAPHVKARKELIIRAGLFNKEGKAIHETNIECTVFPAPAKDVKSVWVNSRHGRAFHLSEELGLRITDSMEDADVLLMDDMEEYSENRDRIDHCVNSGKVAVFLELSQGDYELAETKINVKNCRMGSYYFVSPETGHRLVTDFSPFDFRFWYDAGTKTIRPLLDAMIKADGWNRILTTGDTGWMGDAIAAAEKPFGKGMFRICEVNLSGRVKENPVAYLFAQRLLLK